MRRLFTIALFALGCSSPFQTREWGPAHEAPVVIHLKEADADRVAQDWEHARRRMPVRLRAVSHDMDPDSDPGTIHVFYQTIAWGNTIGLTQFGLCQPFILVDPTYGDDTTLAHELGHALGLHHHRRQSNIMYYRALDTRQNFSKHQRRVMRASARNLARCRRYSGL